MRKIFFIIPALVISFGSLIKGQNIGFESTSPGAYTTANAVTGWTISSETHSIANCVSPTSWVAGSAEFSIVSTPILSFPGVGIIPNSPLGGSNVAQLNNTIANGSITRLTRSIAVTSSSSLLQLAFAGNFLGAGTNCCEEAGFKIQLIDQFGVVMPCSSFSMTPGAGCQSPGLTFSVTTPAMNYWSNWQVKYIDLTPFINTNVTLEIVSRDCATGGHYGTLLFDAAIGSQLIGSGLTTVSPYPVTTSYFCSGSNQAQLFAPIGYQTYQWYAPNTGSIAAPQGTQSSLVVMNPVAGSVYTVMMVAASGCIYTYTTAIAFSTVGIAGIGASPSCSLGTSGSATVAGAGSGTGYDYTWRNATNAVVGTSSIVSGLAPGIYSITLTALGSLGCGTAVATVTVNTAPTGTTGLLKPFCGSEAYLSASGGTNYQWYNNTTLIPAGQGGTAASYTATQASSGSAYWLSYMSSQGCKDSLKYTLVAVPPGSISVSSPSVCPGANNGLAVVSMTASNGAPVGANSFSVFSSGTVTPAYSASLNPTSVNTFTATNLSAGGTYSVSAFDGSCKYSAGFSVTPFIFNYTLSPASPTLCSGNSVVASVSFSNSGLPSQFSYSWSPLTFLAGSFGLGPTAIITPTAAPGFVNTTVYTVIVTPTVINCPLTKTISITAANPLTPTITAIPALCSNGPNYTITANPPGGTFINGSSQAIGANGVLNTALASLGSNSFTYASSIGTCVAAASAFFQVHAPPVISISGNVTICEGQSTTLLASGASSFAWSNNSQGPLITISPASTGVYSVVGSDALTSCSNSAMVTVTVLPLPVISVSGNTAICAGQSATLTAGGADTYSWSNGFSGQTLVISPMTSTSYTVYGTTTLGACSDAEAIAVTVSACVTGIAERNGDQEGLSVYPNPVGGKLFIETENEIDIIVYNELGMTVRKEHLMQGAHSIDMTGLSDGVYLLGIVRNEKMKMIKVIKTR